jgi:hypothetical protein
MTALVAASDGSVQLDVGQIFSSAYQVVNPARVPAQTDTPSRAVTVDLAKLGEVRDAGGGRLTLNLFEDVTLSGLVQSVRVHPGGYSITGQLDDHEHGRFHLVVYDDVLVGVVRPHPDATYNIRYSGDGTHVARQIDMAGFPRCGVTHETTRHFRDTLGKAATGDISRTDSSSDLGGARSADDGGVHDILVLYSDVTREAAGGTSAVRAEIQLAIDVANDTYADSAVTSRLRLVHMEEIAYDEATGWDGYQDHLVRLGVPDDGYFDYIHDLRDQLGADFVSLIVEDTDPDVFGNGTCGMAPVMQELSPDFEALAFSVVSRECAADNWSLVHEVGHNQGCAHNRENASVEGLFTYSYGLHFTGDTRGWSTVMAYDDAENNWQRIGQFSNPNLSHDGAATGIPIGDPGEAHNVSTINSTRVTIARFRTTRYWVDFGWSGTENGLFDSPFSTFADGLSAVPDGGMLVVKSGGSVSGGRILANPVKINSWNGSTVIGAGGP